MVELFGGHNIDPGEFFVGVLTDWDGSGGNFTRVGDRATSCAVRLPAFAGLPAPEVGGRYYYSPASLESDSGAIVRPYTGPGSGSDSAPFRLGTLTSWYPRGAAMKVIINQQGDAYIAPADYYTAIGDLAFGHLTRDGADRKSVVVLAAEFDRVPDILTPVYYNWRALGSTPTVSVIPSPSYAGLPAADVGARYFYQIGGAGAVNLRPVDPIAAGPRG